MDIYSTYYLNGVVVTGLRTMPKLFSQMFTETILSDKEEIAFDEATTVRPRLTPFVHPMAKGRVVEGLGYQTRSLKPAYVKDIRAHYPHKYQKRMAGEDFGGTMTTDQRMRAALAADVQDQLDMLNNRFEAMAAEAVIYGTQTIKGEGFDSLVDFGRDPATKIALSGADKWDTLPATPTKEQCVAFLDKVFGQLEAWAEMMRDNVSATPSFILMDSKAWGHIRRALSFVDASGTLLDKSNKGYDRISVDLTPSMAGEMGLNAKGTFGDFPIFTFQSEYMDPETGQMKRLMPDNTVLLIARSMLMGVRHFGAILDIDVLRPLPYWSDSWTEKNPSVRMLQLQSAPLMVPYRPNAVLTVTVA